MKSTDKGLTLIELAVAVLVLAIGSIAAIRATEQSRLAIGGESPRLLARIAVRNRAEELQLYGATTRSLPDTVQMGQQIITLSSDTETTAAGLIKATVTARAQSGEGAQLILYLPARVPQ